MIPFHQAACAAAPARDEWREQGLWGSKCLVGYTPLVLTERVASRSSRVTGLDGLRGLAAVVVVVHHVALAHFTWSEIYYNRGSERPKLDAIVSTPLHLAWAGTEAVYVFFIISGYALALAVRSASYRPNSFLASRIVRLYLPTIASIILAWTTFKLFPRPEGDGYGFWLDGSPRVYDFASMLRDSVLVTGVTRGNSPLWSLVYEVLFSLLLPLYILVARRMRATLALVFAALLSTLGFVYQTPAFIYMPMFLVGVVLAESSGRWRPWVFEKVKMVRWRWGFYALLSLALVGAVAQWYFTWTGSESLKMVLGFFLSFVSCSAIVAAAAGLPLIERFLTWKPIAWLGSISFSLYLVHEPIIKAAAFTFQGSEIALVVAVLIAFAVATLFYRHIEKPIHRLSQRVKAHSGDL